jgi:hypothetical protein
MEQEHRLVEIVLKYLARVPLGEANADQIHRIDRNEGEQCQDDEKEPAHPGADGRNIPPTCLPRLAAGGSPGITLATCVHHLSAFKKRAYRG